MVKKGASDEQPNEARNLPHEVQEKVGAELGVSLGDVEKDTLHSSHRLFAFPSAPVYHDMAVFRNRWTWERWAFASGYEQVILACC
jgi:hypothetical protein